MKFSEAMGKLKDGSKITRQEWKGSVYFKIEDGLVKSFQPSLNLFVYDDDIMISDGWLILGGHEEYKFCDIILFLQQGYKAKLKEWSKTFIFLDESSRSLVIHSMEHLPFIPDFGSFCATDWIEIDDY